LSAPASGRGRGAGGGGGRGEAAYPEGAFVGQAPPRYSINGQYGTITSRMKPPYTQIYKYDLNKGTIVWHAGFGDDPQLAAQGVHDTGSTQMRNSVIVTSTGLVIGASRDGYIRAWDADTGKKLWAAPVGGNTVGQPAMFEVDGKQYLLMGVGPALLAGTVEAQAARAGGAGGRAGAAGGGAGRGAAAAPAESTRPLPHAPDGPKGLVAFALSSGSAAAKK
jgi:outer membrane protein assembly factor BamB